MCWYSSWEDIWLASAKEVIRQSVLLQDDDSLAELPHFLEIPAEFDYRAQLSEDRKLSFGSAEQEFQGQLFEDLPHHELLPENEFYL